MADQIQDGHPRNYRKWYACIYAYETVENIIVLKQILNIFSE